MGHQTKSHLAQRSALLQQGRRPQLSAHSKAVWLGSSSVAECPQVPTGCQRECGAREIIRQCGRAQDKETKGSQSFSQPAPQGSTLHVPLISHTASSFSPHPIPVSPTFPLSPLCCSLTCLALSLTVWLNTVQMTPWAQGGVVRDPSYRKQRLRSEGSSADTSSPGTQVCEPMAKTCAGTPSRVIQGPRSLPFEALGYRDIVSYPKSQVDSIP